MTFFGANFQCALLSWKTALQLLLFILFIYIPWPLLASVTIIGEKAWWLTMKPSFWQSWTHDSVNRIALVSLGNEEKLKQISTRHEKGKRIRIYLDQGICVCNHSSNHYVSRWKSRLEYNIPQWLTMPPKTQLCHPLLSGCGLLVKFGEGHNPEPDLQWLDFTICLWLSPFFD